VGVKEGIGLQAEVARKGEPGLDIEQCVWTTKELVYFVAPSSALAMPYVGATKIRAFA